MVRCLNDNNICAEIWPKEKTERLDGIRSLGLASRKAELSELLVWLEHDHVRTKHNASLLLFVIVYLHSSIVRHTEGDDLRLIPSGSTIAWAS